MSYNTFLQRMHKTGSSLRDERIQSAIDNIAYSFTDDPSYLDGVVFYWNEEPIHPRISESINRETGTPRTTMMTQITEPFEMGDIFKFPDGTIWICTYQERRQTHFEGTLEFCNCLLNFEKDEDGTIITYPVIVQNSTQYNSGITYSDYVTYGSAQNVIYTVQDDYSLKIDKDFRFLIDYNTTNPTAYLVTQVDTTTYKKGGKGLVRYTVIEDELRSTDDIENMIADNTKRPDMAGDEGWL